MNGMTRLQRNKVLSVYYSFECACSACSLDGEALMLSDARSRILSALTFKLQDQEVLSFEYLERLTPEIAERPDVIRGMPVHDAKIKLSRYERIAYNFLLAKVIESEGLKGETLARAYASAAAGLLFHMQSIDPIVILQSAALCTSWFEKAVTAMRAARGPGHKDLREVEELAANAGKSEQLSLYRSVMANPKAFFGPNASSVKAYAMQMGEVTDVQGLKGLQIQALNERECKEALEKLRKGGKLTMPSLSGKIADGSLKPIMK